MPSIKNHKYYLILAHNYSLKFLGNTYPNPSVGCIIVDYNSNKNGKIISYGYTGKSGRPHAEEVALKKIKKFSRKVFLYVTLEPCFHKSLNRSCVDQIIKSGIKNVCIASKDPDKRTNNKSISKLKKNGIKVLVGITKNQTFINNRFFFVNKKFNRSYIKYKIAASKDFKIAKSNFNSKWISNKYSRNFVHDLRYKNDAILTTYNTIKYDNPRLTLRYKNYPKYKNSIIILDTKLQIDRNSTVVKSANKRKVIIFTISKDIKKIQILKKLNCNIITVNKVKNNFDLLSIFKKTYKLGISSIFIEAGGTLFTSMYNKKLIDEFHLFVSPKKIGKNGIPMYSGIKDFSLKTIKNLLITKRYFYKDKYYQFNM